MRVRTWGLISILALVAAVVVALALSSGPEPAEARSAGPGSSTLTEDGVRWRFAGRSVVVVTVTAEASASVRRRLKDPLVVGCSRVPTLGSPGKARTAIARTRFATTPGTFRVRLAPRITRADTCFVERRDGGEDVVGVQFPASAYASTSGGEAPPDADRTAIVATLDQYFTAHAAKDRPRECATYTANAARAVAAFQRRFLGRPVKRKDCVSAYRALDRELDRLAPEDSSSVPLDVDEDVRTALRSPEKLDLKVKRGRARISRTGTPLDFGFELIRVDGRWLIDRRPS